MDGAYKPKCTIALEILTTPKRKRYSKKTTKTLAVFK